ncbi:MAG: prevent-host-death protein [Methyloglobulus sp.]|nr:prevent-host-death protein [Methyloglobulus sp.]
MFRTEGIYSLTEFQRNARSHLERLKKSGQPEVLTVNGQAEIVVQDAAAYQVLVDKLEAIEGIRKGLEAMNRGEGRGVDAFFNEFERKHAIQG